MHHHARTKCIDWFITFQVEDVVVTVPFPKQVLNVNLTPSGEVSICYVIQLFSHKIVYGESGTRFVKNRESQSRTKSPKNLKLKMLWPLCNQTINLETDSKTLCYRILKLKYSPFI